MLDGGDTFGAIKKGQDIEWQTKSIFVIS